MTLEEKLRYWREHGGVPVTFGGRYGYGTRDDWHDKPSVAQREKEQVAALKAKGTDFERAS